MSGHEHGDSPANNVFYKLPGRTGSPRLGTRLTEGSDGGTTLPSLTIGINAPSSSSAATDRRQVWSRGPERDENATNDTSDTMNTTSHSDSHDDRGEQHDTKSSVTAIIQRYRGDPGSAVAVPGEPYSGAGELRGSDVLSDTDLGVEDWSRTRDDETNRPILVKRETITGLEIAGELCPEDHPTEENSDYLPGTTVELGYTDGETEYIANAEINSVRVPRDEDRPLVTDGGLANAVPIRREVDASADESDPDHIRGAKYANLLLGTDYGKGDVVQLLYLERVHPDFFEGIDFSRFDEEERALYQQFRRNPAVICVDDPDLLPEEFWPHDEQPPKVVDRR